MLLYMSKLATCNGWEPTHTFQWRMLVRELLPPNADDAQMTRAPWSSRSTPKSEPISIARRCDQTHKFQPPAGR